MHTILILILFLLSGSNLWAQEGIGSLISPGDLSAVHQKYDGIANCTKCHELGRGVPDSKCLDCHDKLAERIKSGQGLHAKYTAQCISCHDEHKGKDFRIVSLARDKFRHDDTGYQLKDRHAEVKCDKCHKKEGVYAGLSRDCISCHADKHNGQLDRDCGRCHGFTGWKNVGKFRHGTDSRYDLTGKHIDVRCAKCHADNRFKIEKFEECITCHKDPHKGKPSCKECHTTEGWKKVKIDHSKTNYPLAGKHLDVVCEKCHKNNQLKGIPFAVCNSAACHSNPHKEQFADRKCEACHDTKGWKPSLFNHRALEYAGFRLEGKHTDTPCGKCHAEGRFRPLDSKTCETSDCHKDPHKAQFKGRACDSCHTIKGWKPSLFNHNAPEYAGFKLDGRHSDTSCEKCHAEGRFRPLDSKTCETSDCHKDPHKGQFKGRACDGCHTTKGWKPSSFNHNVPEYKGFKLDGRHVNAACEKCHAGGGYKPVGTGCSDCHEKDDVHKKELGRGCERCHNTSDWKKPALDHNRQTVFPLTGKHVGTGCDKCHPEKRYRMKSYKCKDCHKDIHKGKFKEECSSCHTPQDWEPRKFEHGRKTGFELKGVHNDIVCINCHKTKGEYEKVNRYCNQCHADPHLNQFGSIGCPQCHSESSWTPTLFNHSKTGYPLVGRHRSAECRDCHKDRVYRGITAACVGCHLSEYAAAPNHVAKGYSQDCTRCHDSAPTAWIFNHAKVAAGGSCSTCHINRFPASHSASGFSASCENCHKYSTAGWVFYHPAGAVSCAASGCHLTYSSPPRPASHAANNWTTCQGCHKYPTWQFAHSTASSGCGSSGCHLIYSNPTRPANHATYNWTTCERCHRYPTWTFIHPFTTFPLNHKGTSPSDCNACHAGGAYTNKGGCRDCHGNEHNKGYSNAQCLSCHPAGKG